MPEGFVLQGDIPQAAKDDGASEQHAADASAVDDDIVVLADTNKKRTRAPEGIETKRVRARVDEDAIVVLDD